MASIGDIVAHLKLDISNFSNNLDTAVNEIESTQNKMQGITKVGDAFKSVGATLTAAVTAPIVGLGVASIKTGMEFDSSMSKVQALSGASAQDMAKLEKVARDMGKSTVFSATEAADALGYMALAGWDVNESTDALPGVLNLAAASGMGLAEASDMCTDYMSAFGMEANRAGEFADMLAYAQANSNTTTAQLGEAFKNCAVNCNGFGMDAQQTTAALGLLANQGLKGAEAGTALNAVIRDMTSKMKDGHIQIGKTNVAVTDAQGNFRNFSDIVADVQKATEGMTEAERLNALQGVFTADSIKAMGILTSGTKGELEGFTDELYNSSGAAQEMADTMNDNLAGDLKELGSAFGELKLQISDALSGAIRPIIQGLTDLINKFLDLPAPVKNFILALAGIVAAIGPLLFGIGSAITIFKKLKDNFLLIKTAGTVLKGFLSGALTSAFTAVSGFITGTVIPAFTSLWAFMLANPITFVIAAIAALVAAFIYCWNNVDGFKEFFVNAWENIKQAASNAAEWIGQAIDNIVQWFQTLPERISQWLQTTIQNVQQWCSDMWNKAVEAGSKFVEGVINFITSLPERIWFLLCFVISYIVLWTAQMIQNAIQAGQQFVQNVVQFIQELPGKIWNFLTDAWNKTKTWATNMWNTAKDAGTKFLQAVVQFFTQLPGKVWSFLVNCWNRAKTWASNMASAARQAGQQFLSNVVNFITQLPGRVASFLSQCWNRAVSWARQMGQAGANAARQLVSRVVSGLAGLPGKMASVGRSIVQGIINGVSGAAGRLFSKMKSIASNALKAAKNALGINSPSKVFRDVVGRSIPEGIAVGVVKSEDEAIKSIDDMTADLVKSINVGALMDSVNIKPSGTIINNSNKSLASAINGLIDKVTSNENSERTIQVNLNIDNFNNNTKEDINKIAEDLAFYMKRKRL